MSEGEAMKARRSFPAVGVGLVAAIAATMAFASGVTSPAKADNSGRRVCLYGLVGTSASTQDGTEGWVEFAVADVKRSVSSGLVDLIGCPAADQEAFLKARGRTGTNRPGLYPWWDNGKARLTCEDFLQSADYLEGVVPDDFSAKDVNSFCDNTKDDTLYSFRKTYTVDSSGRRTVTTTATNTDVKVRY
jgi:hypothetical protein